MKNTKFWLAVGVVSAMVAVIVIYLFKADRPELSIMALPFGVITLIVGAYYQANVAASDQATKAAIAGVKIP